jgi:hypothetical protein
MTDLAWGCGRWEVNEEAAKDRRCADSVNLQGAGLVCAVLDALVIALYVTIDELVGLAEAGLPAQRKATGDQLALGSVGRGRQFIIGPGASRPAALTDGVEDISTT